MSEPSTPIEQAALSGDAARVSELVALGALDERSGPAALEAALGGLGRVRSVVADPQRAIDTIAVLLAAGVDPRARSARGDGRTLAGLAGLSLVRRELADEVHVRVLERFFAHGITVEDLRDDPAFRHGPATDLLAAVVLASKRAESAVLAFLVANGVPPTGTPGQATVLHALVAIDADRDAIVRWLERGASLEARDGSGRTPLLAAAACRATRAVAALLALGARADAIDDRGRSAHGLADERGDVPELARTLAAAGSPVQPGYPPPERHGAPAPVLVPAGAVRAEVIAGRYRGLGEVRVIARPDGGFDGFVTLFGQEIATTFRSDEIALVGD